MSPALPAPQETPEDSLVPLDPALAAELPTFEQFFKTFGFKRIHGRVWGLLVLSEEPLSSREICARLDISQGAVSGTLNELVEWGAITSHFDPARRCHLHAPVGNALSIAATILRRREQVAFQQFRSAADRAVVYIRGRYGERDPRLLTLRSIISACEIADALMKLLVSAVANALGDSQSILSRAIQAALKVGFGASPKSLFQSGPSLPDAAEGAQRAANSTAGSPANSPEDTGSEEPQRG